MKPVLYLGAMLMIGASVYGVVDYSKTNSNKKFSNMYETKEVNEPVIVKEEPTPVIEEKTAVQPAKKKTIGSRLPLKEEKAFTKSNIDITPAEKMDAEPVLTEIAELKENNAAEKYKKAKKRKLNHKLFSRAPLREEIDLDEELTVPAKMETKKAAVKKQ